MTRRAHSFGPKAQTAAQHRVALQSMLLMRRSLDGLDAESLVRSYGLAPAEVTAMIESERLRRERRA